MRMQSSLFSPEMAEQVDLESASDRTYVRAIEDSRFPFEEISKIAKQESWRKEVNRPIYHIHKWWAQRLGSVFRALALGVFNDSESDIVDLFYRPSRIRGVVFDPFMGSGTTVGEVLKLGGSAVGQDINPVAYLSVKNALNLPGDEEVCKVYRAIEADTAQRILDFYLVKLPSGQKAQVLYFFWVKFVGCPHCANVVDLFSSYVFAQNAYPGRRPEVRVVCPQCGDISTGMHGTELAKCAKCGHAFNPLKGPVRGALACCLACRKQFEVLDAVKREGRPPRHRLYAKLVIDTEGQKFYLPADDYDRQQYELAERELATLEFAYPVVEIKGGYNTRQALNYCYRYWHEMFNARQLLCMSILGKRIRSIPDERMRELFCCLFSGMLEFNNMFASYKGEGTGAVRHMFSHHVLKPERTPIEANIWGTPKSSGSFSTMFRNRLLRAIEYAEDPFELKLNSTTSKTVKIFGLSAPLTGSKTSDRLRLRCSDSSSSGLADESVDAVITDPPFFDNVHYSELADFFHVWQQHILQPLCSRRSETTRNAGEVQHTEAPVFEDRLSQVWKECHRVLKNDALLVFTFHHSRKEAWISLLNSLVRAGFVVVRVHPIVSELSLAAPKHQAKDPISLDIIFVCRKSCFQPLSINADVIEGAKAAANDQLQRLLRFGFNLSRNDVRLLVRSNAVQLLSALGTEASTTLIRLEADLERISVDLVNSSSQTGHGDSPSSA